MKKTLFVETLLFLHVITSTSIFEAIMFRDVIQALKQPYTVIALLCCPLFQNHQIYKAINESNITQIHIQFSTTDKILQKHILDHLHTLFLVDMSCPNITDFLKKSEEEEYFRSPYRWILFNSKRLNTSIVPKAVCNISILPDSEICVIRQLEKNFYDLHFIYKVSPEKEWKSEFYGLWSVNEQLQISNKFIRTTALRRRNLNGQEIKISYVLTDSDSINHLSDRINDHIDTITKVNFATTNQLLDFLNAEKKYVFTDTWGYRHNNTWNGMTGYLVRGEVEIGGSPMFFTTERMRVVEYISSPTPTRSKFVFQQAKLSYENNLFLLSFQSTVWYSTVALICVLYIALFLVAVWEWKKNSQNMNLNKSDAGILRANVSDVAILIFGATCQQGSTVELKGSLGRMVMLVLFLTVMFLYTSYAANIVALLQSSSSQIRTLDDLLHSRIKFGVHDTIYNRYYFSTATEPVRKAIYETKIAPPGSEPRFMSMEEGVKKMRQGLFAFHMETGVGYKFVGRYFKEGEKCGLKEIQYLQVIDPWLAVRKNSPYLEMYKIGLKRIQEHGLQNRQNRLSYQNRPKCSGREANFVSVSMVDCYPAFLILSYGALIAIILMIFEVLHHRKRNIIVTKI